MKKMMACCLVIISLLVSSVSVYAAIGGTCNVLISTYLVTGKKVSSTVTKTNDANRKFATAEIYLRGDAAYNPTYWKDISKVTKNSITASEYSVRAVNGYGLCYLSDTSGNYIHHDQAGTRHG